MVILSLLARCSTKSKDIVVYKNGTYEVYFGKSDKNGWIWRVKIKIGNEKIVNIDFNNMNAVTGELITDDDTYIKIMYAATKAILAKASKQLSVRLIKTTI